MFSSKLIEALEGGITYKKYCFFFTIVFIIFESKKHGVSGDEVLKEK